MKSLEIIIEGEIKDRAIAFRAMRIADSFNLSGKACYKSNDRLVIEAEGESNLLAEFISWCSKLSFEEGIEKMTINKGFIKNYTQFDLAL